MKILILFGLIVFTHCGNKEEEPLNRGTIEEVENNVAPVFDKNSDPLASGENGNIEEAVASEDLLLTNTTKTISEDSSYKHISLAASTLIITPGVTLKAEKLDVSDNSKITITPVFSLNGVSKSVLIEVSGEINLYGAILYEGASDKEINLNLPGGELKLTADKLSVFEKGLVSVNGTNNINSISGNGTNGGTIYLSAKTLEISGKISGDGGNTLCSNKDSCKGGDGGKITISAPSKSFILSQDALSVLGGNGAKNGKDGTIEGYEDPVISKIAAVSMNKQLIVNYFLEATSSKKVSVKLFFAKAGEFRYQEAKEVFEASKGNNTIFLNLAMNSNLLPGAEYTIKLSPFDKVGFFVSGRSELVRIQGE